MPAPRWELSRWLYFMEQEWASDEPLNLEDFLHLVARVSCFFPDPGECVLCGDDDDYYIVTDELWQEFGARHHHHICIGCLEHRMGRRLTPDDFPDCGINRGQLVPLSKRHEDRMAKAEPE